MANNLQITHADFCAVETERCRRDVFYFINEYVKIEDRDTEGLVIPFQLWNSQKPVLKHFLENRLVQVMKANQLGLTWLIIAYATWRALFKAGYSVKVISETETKAKEVTRRIDFILRHLPNWIVSDNKFSDGIWFEPTALSITLHFPKINAKEQEKSVVQTFASSPTAAAGFTANLFLFDEWALQEYAREIWTYAYPTINRPKGGQVIGLSTIERGTLFEDIWRDNKNFKKIFLSWSSDPRRNQKWYDNTLSDLGLDETRKHYPATAEEALAIPGGAFFGKFSTSIHLREPLDEIPDWCVKYRSVDYGLDTLACYFYYVDNYGFARIYKEIHLPGLVISNAAYMILKESGAPVPETPELWDGLTISKKKGIAGQAIETFRATIAPPDMFVKSKETGRKSEDIWRENGIILYKGGNNLIEGCRAMSQWLKPLDLRDEQTGELYRTAKLTIDKNPNGESVAPFLTKSLLNIQRDKHNDQVYSKQPHNLTHSVDSVRYFCTEIIASGINKEEQEEQKKQELRDTPYPQFHNTNKFQVKIKDKQLKM